jgi:hypothetical protein
MGKDDLSFHGLIRQRILIVSTLIITGNKDLLEKDFSEKLYVHLFNIIILFIEPTKIYLFVMKFAGFGKGSTPLRSNFHRSD